MPTSDTRASTRGSTSATTAAKERFLAVYDKEHATTMKVLRAFPRDKTDLRPHPAIKSARELAWIFVLERGLGQHVFVDDIFSHGGPKEKPPAAPDSWDAVLDAVETSHVALREKIRAMSDAEMEKTVRFFVGPKTLDAIPRMDFLWFLLHDEIHHRGQFSVYLRMAGGKVPSIYGPTADEPWF